MSRVIIDEATRAQLDDLTEQVEICDRDGRVLGVFVPSERSRRELYEWAKAQISDEELDRRMREPGGSTLAEIWERLGRT